MPAGPATNVQVLGLAQTHGVRRESGPPCNVFAAELARPLSCIWAVLTWRRHQPAAYTSHPKVREGHEVCICGGENFKGLRAPRPTSRCGIRHRRLEYAGAWPTLQYPLQHCWLAGFPAFAPSLLDGGTNLLLIHHTPRSGRATMCASVVGKTSRPAGTVTNVKVQNPAPPPRNHGSLAYLEVSFAAELARPLSCIRVVLTGRRHQPSAHTPRSWSATTCAAVAAKTSRPAGTATNVQVRHPVLSPRVRGSLAYHALSFAALLARRLSCICAVFTGRRHQPAAYTSHPKVREGLEVCICGGGENVEACGHRDQRSRCCVWRRSLEYAGVWPTLHYPLQQSWLAGFPAFAPSLLGGGTNLPLIHHTPRSGRATMCASVAGKTAMPAGPATNVQVRHPVLPPRVCGSLAYHAVSFAALLARRLSCICAVFTRRRHQPAAYTSHPKVREGYEGSGTNLLLTHRGPGGPRGVHLWLGKLQGLRAPRPTSRCGTRCCRLESAVAWPTLLYPLQHCWLAGFPAFAPSLLGGGTNLLLIHHTPRSGEPRGVDLWRGKLQGLRAPRPTSRCGIRCCRLESAGASAYLAVSLAAELARPLFLHSHCLDRAAAPTCSSHTEVLEGDDVCICGGENVDACGPRDQRPGAAPGADPGVRGSLAHPAVSFAAELARPLSCISAVLTGWLHQPAAYTSHPKVLEGDDVCICGGENVEACGHRDQRPGAASGADPGSTREPGPPCSILCSRADSPAFLHLRGPNWATAPTCCLYITAQGPGGPRGVHLWRGKQ
ncbi:hypothetical protein MRX96_010103 [Rhipicephalus microplus]